MIHNESTITTSKLPEIKKSKKRVNRQAFGPPQNEAHIPLTPILTSAKSDLLMSLSQLPIAGKAFETLNKIAEQMEYSAHFPLFDTLIHFCHKQLQNVITAQKEILRYEELTPLLNKFESQMYSWCYLILSNVILEHHKSAISTDEQLKWASLFPDANLIPSLNEMIVMVNSERCKKKFLDRFSRFKGDHTKKYSDAITAMTTPLNHISMVCDCVPELMKMPSPILIAITDTKISKILKWPSVHNNSSPIKEMKSFQDCLQKMLKAVYEKGWAGSGPSHERVEQFFSLQLDLFDLRSSNETTFNKKVLSLQSSWDHIHNVFLLAHQNYLCVKSGQLTFNDFLNEFKSKDQCPIADQDEFEKYLFKSSILSLTFRFTLESACVFANEMITKNFAALSPDYLLKFEVNSFKIHSLMHHDSYWTDISSQFEKCVEELKRFADDQMMLTFQDCKDKFLKLNTLLIEGEDKSLINKLRDLLFQENPHYVDYVILKESLKTVQTECKKFKEFFDVLNPVLQKAIDQTENTIDLQPFESELILFRKEISKFIGPLLDLPYAFDHLVSINPKKHTSKIWEINVEDHEIPFLFNVSFKHTKEKPLEVPALTPDKVLQKVPHPQNMPAKEKPMTAKVRPTPTKIVNANAASVITHPPQIEEDDECQSNKLGKLIKFLTAKGWAPKSVNGSHLKLELNHRSLIVPINKSHLKPGTFNAILMQERIKRDL